MTSMPSTNFQSPVDWQTVRLGDFGSIYGGLTGMTSKDFGHGDFRFVTFLNVISNAIVNPSGTALVDVGNGRTQNAVKTGDILFNSSSETPEEVAHACAVTDALDGALLNSFCFGYRPRSGAPIDPTYIAYWSRSTIGRTVLDVLAQGSTRYNISKTALLVTELRLPQLEEQRAVVTVLTDLDQAIKDLDARVSKQEWLRQAAMTALLSGSQRLGTFTERWSVESLGSLATMRSGGTPPTSVSSYYGGKIPWVSISDMSASGKYMTSTDRTLSEAGLAASAAVLYPKGTLLYAMYASIGACSIALTECTSSQAILGIQVGARLDLEFLYYHLVHNRSEILKMGQTGTQSNLNAMLVRDLRVSLPSIDEQRAIATVLTDMDQAITDLRAERAKLAALREATASDLLSGRKRLV